MQVYFVGVNVYTFLRAAAVSVNGSSVQRLSCVNVGINRYMCMVQWSTTVTKWGLLSCVINDETGFSDTIYVELFEIPDFNNYIIK